MAAPDSTRIARSIGPVTLMRTFPVRDAAGRLLAFEIRAQLFGWQLARALRNVPEVTDVRSRKWWTGSPDVHIRFQYQGREFVVWEPFADSSRWHIGPEDHHALDISFDDLQRALAISHEATPNPIRSFLAFVVCCASTAALFFIWATAPVLDVLGIDGWRAIGMIVAVVVSAASAVAARSPNSAVVAAMGIGLLLGVGVVEGWHNDASPGMFDAIVDGMKTFWLDVALLFACAVIGVSAVRYLVARHD